MASLSSSLFNFLDGPIVTTSLPWQQRLGRQRDWVWRGWKTRYTYLRPAQIEHDSVPIILLHGFGASIGHWRNNLEVLGQTHTVYALDMLGFGASEKVIAPYSIGFWVSQVYDFWHTFIGRPAVLIGNSIGSLVCLSAAAEHPEMVQGVAMLSLHDPSLQADMMQEMVPAPLLPIVSGLEALVKAIVFSPLILAPLFRLIRRPQVVRPWAKLAYANPEAVTDELVEILTGPAQDQGSTAAFCAIFKAISSPQFGSSARQMLANLQIPLLLIWGKQDRMIPFALSRQFRQVNPALQLVELEGAGHCPHDEVPDQVNQQILEWISSWVSTESPDLIPVN